MTTMLKDALKLYGLNENEIIVFLALIELGGGFAKDLIEYTKFHKNIIYDNIYKLIDKGLVSEALVDNKKFFSSESPDVITEFISNTQKKFTLYKKEMELLKKKIQEKQKAPSKTQIKMFTGIEGVKQIFRHELDIGKDYFVIGAPKESVELVGELFWKSFNIRQRKSGMKGKIIFNESLREFGKVLGNDLIEIRFFEKMFEPLTEIMIYDKFVATIVWSKEPVGTLIENEEVAKSYKKYFDILWMQTKK